MGRMDIFHLACQMGRETSTALKHSEKKVEEERGGAAQEESTVSAMGYASFFTAIGRGGGK